MDDLRERLARLPLTQRTELERRLLERASPTDEALRPEAHPAGAAPTGGAPRILPASFAQRRLWFVSQLDPQSSWYNVPSRLLLRGTLDVPALERALAFIVARHEVLRTTFVLQDGEPHQVIGDPAPLTLPLEDLSSCPAGERRALGERLAREEARRPFDLTRGPLFRVRLWRIGVDEHLLLTNVHHIVFDGWSSGILSRELTACYAAFARGEEPELPPLPAQYADYTMWQRAWLRGETYARQLDYWRGRLASAPARLDLPTDHPRPRTRSVRGGVKSLRLPPALAAAVIGLGRQEGVTAFMTLLAAFQALLSRYSGSNDIVVGSPIANRRRPELEPLIGFFVNSLALRTDLSGDPGFRELLRRVREVALGAYAHQDIPFEKVVEELQPDRFQDWNPLFQVMVTVQNVPRGALTLPGLTIERVRAKGSTSKFDLTLYVAHGAGGFRLMMEYRTDLFAPETIARMLQHLQILLEGVVAEPDRPLSAIPVAPAEELRRTVLGWNATDRDYPRDGCVHRLFERRAAAHPDRTAVASTAGVLRYGELNRRANQLARLLRGAGVGPGVRVAVELERSTELAVAFLAVLKTGGAYVPLDPSHPPARLALMMEDASVGAVVTTGPGGVAMPPHIPVIRLDRVMDALAAESADDLPIAGRGDDLAYVMFTSGSTGRPKGIAIPHRAILRLVCNTDYVELSPDDRIAQVSNASFDAATFEFWGAFLNGARLVIFDREVTLSPDAFAEEVARHGITTIFLTTALFNSLVDAVPAAFASIRTVLFGGEAADAARARALLAGAPPGRLLNVYGPTETTTFATWFQVRDVAEDATTLPIGRPIANTRAYVLDRRCAAVAIGEPGELYLGGPGVGWGYVGRPALTAECFVPDPFGPDPGARLYRTGDRVRWRPDGTLEFLGRLDAQLKLRGFRVEPAEIEAVLASHPAVRESVVAVHEDPSGNNNRLVAYVVPRAEERPADAAGAEADHLADWRALYDELYGGSASPDATFDTVGWNSSYTGGRIPDLEMGEWLEQTVQAIRALRPRRVLEIGCGTGMLLFRIAPDTEAYLGTDFSRPVLARLRSEVERRGLPNVRLLEREAADLSGLEPVDLVILNSVTQYLPGLEYLGRLLERAAGLIVPGGAMFIGDVRNYDLLEAFHASVQLHRASDGVSVDELRRRLTGAVAGEPELTISPAYFAELPLQIPTFRWAEVRPKRGRADNELTRFRYDVVLHASSPPAGSPTEWVTWHDGEGSCERVAELLQGHDTVALRGVPNSRTIGPALVRCRLAEPDGPSTAAELRALESSGGGVEPEALFGVAERLGYQLTLSWASAAPDGRFDALFQRHGPAPVSVPAGQARRPRGPYANQPVARSVHRGLGRELKSWLRDRLPDYMVPAAIMPLASLPLSPNGKVDRRALPAPEPPRGGAREAPREGTEATIGAVWRDLLGVDEVAREDDFFDLGGHSLLAVKLFGRIERSFGVRLPLATLFQAASLAQLAQAVDVALAREAPPQEPLVTLQPHGTLPPVFWVHDVDGRVLCYRSLIRHLGADRPMYGFELPRERDGRPVLQTIEELASRYVRAMRAVQPSGPYHVGGYCWAGGLAYEVARQLRAGGHEVAFLGLIESTCPGHLRERGLWYRVRRHLRVAATRRGAEVLRYLGRRAWNGWSRFSGGVALRLSHRVGRPLVRSLYDVRTVLSRALRQYRPGPYAGPVTLFQVQRGTLRRSHNGWERVVRGEILTVEIEGRHLTVLDEPFAASLAERIRASLQETAARPAG